MYSPCLRTLASLERQILDYDKTVSKEDSENEVKVQEWNKCGLYSKYIGRIFKNNLHNFGYYLQIGNVSYLYEGAFYCNRFEGYGTVMYDNCTYFEGLFKDNKIFGLGVLTDLNHFQEVAWWDGSQIIRLIDRILPECIPTLKKPEIVSDSKNNEEGNTSYRALNMLRKTGLNIIDQIDSLYNIKVRNPKSNYFNCNLYNNEHFTASPDYNKQIRGNFDICFNEDTFENKDNIDIIEEDAKGSDANLTKSSSNPTKSDSWIGSSTFRLEEINLIKLRKKLREYGEIIERTDEVFNEDDFNAYRKVINSNMLEEMAIHAYGHRDCISNVRFSIKAFLEGFRSDFLKPGIKENACIAFLHRCAEGKRLDAAKLFQRFNLNPDICDGSGNSGLLYATCNNRYEIVAMLCNCGADMNFFNDNGITALTLATLKYLALYHDVKDWNYAFLNISNESSKMVDEKEKYFDFQHTEYVNSIFFECNKEFYFHDEHLKHVRNYDIGELECRLETSNRFLFNLELKKKEEKEMVTKFKNTEKTKMKNTRKKVDVKQSAHSLWNPPNVNDECKRGMLLDIFKMISILLHLGADPNVPAFPMPPLLMSLFLDTPDLLVQLLEFKANPHVVWEKDNMSALHIVVSQSKTNQMMYGMGKIIIENGVNLNVRTGCSHWPDENPSIIGNYLQEEIVNEGKTALHILAMREDFIEDLDGYLSKLVQIMIKSGASVTNKYLGHSPLSLSVLRGNITMVRILLDSGARSEEILEYNMGKASTIYTLVRYEKYLPDIDTCKAILDVLLDYDDLLAPILEFGNVAEFAKAQEISDRKITNKNGTKVSGRIILGQYLLNASHKLILRHYQSIITFNLFYNAKNSTLANNDVCKNMVKLIVFEDAFNMVVKLIHKNFIELSNESHFAYIFSVLKFVNINGYSAKNVMSDTEILRKINRVKLRYSTNKKTSLNLENYGGKRRSFEEKKGVSFKKRHGNEPEFDTDFDKYKVCLNCLRRTDVILLPCTVCGLVYFCSEQCNKIKNMQKTFHTCGILYYQREYQVVYGSSEKSKNYDGVLRNQFKHEELIKLMNCNKTIDDYK